MKPQPSSRYLVEYKPTGTISVNGFYLADFNIPRNGDVITGLFTKLDQQYFIKAELYIDYILYAVRDNKNINLFNNELKFFSDNLVSFNIPYSLITIRIIYNKNCVEHAKIYTTFENYTDPRSLKQESIFIPAAVSVTGKDITINTSFGLVTSELSPNDGDELIFTPVRKFHFSPPQPPNKYNYTFNCPHLGFLKMIRCIGGSGAEATILFNDLRISTTQITNRDQDLVFFHKNLHSNDKYILSTTSLPYCKIEIEVSAYYKMDLVRLELIYKYKPGNFNIEEISVFINDKTKKVNIWCEEGSLHTDISRLPSELANQDTKLAELKERIEALEIENAKLKDSTLG
uniref:Uncharacterized protein n=1 Tax=Marseillevirus LCMAC201 TaxID=2506605 RepID=A0A481YW23_9VIRU|nr:MAG: uncharacterized protein LCMAC201_01220 [Marseillevirus LCMAC201]